MKFLVPNYSCLQNPWLGGYRPQIPVFSVLCPQLNLLSPPNKIPGYATALWPVTCKVLTTVLLKITNFFLLVAIRGLVNGPYIFGSQIERGFGCGYRGPDKVVSCWKSKTVDRVLFQAMWCDLRGDNRDWRIYSVIKKSLCIWRLQYNHQGDTDFLITLYYYPSTMVLHP